MNNIHESFARLLDEERKHLQSFMSSSTGDGRAPSGSDMRDLLASRLAAMRWEQEQSLNRIASLMMQRVFPGLLDPWPASGWVEPESLPHRICELENALEFRLLEGPRQRERISLAEWGTAQILPLQVTSCEWMDGPDSVVCLELECAGSCRTRSVELHCGGIDDNAWHFWLLALQARQVRMEWEGEQNEGHWLGVPATCLVPMVGWGDNPLITLRRSLETVEDLGSLQLKLPEACQNFCHLHVEFYVRTTSRVPLHSPHLNLLRVVDRHLRTLPWNPVGGLGALIPALDTERILNVQRVMRLQGLHPTLFRAGPLPVLRSPVGGLVHLDFAVPDCQGAFLAEVLESSVVGLQSSWADAFPLDIPSHTSYGRFRPWGKATPYREAHPWTEWSGILSCCMEVLWLRSEDWGAWQAFLQALHPTLSASHPLRKVQKTTWYPDSQIMTLNVHCKNLAEQARAWAWAKSLERFQAKALGMKGFPVVEVCNVH